LAPESFFVPDNDRFVPTDFTRGPWDPNLMHAGPPAALLGRAMENCERREGFQFVRMTFEILRPLPLVPLKVRARVVRPGKKVEFLEGSLESEDGELVRASAWRIRTQDTDCPEAGDFGPPPPGPEAGSSPPEIGTIFSESYFTGMEFRFVRGHFLESGPACAWFRMRHPLLPGEQPSPLTRVLAAADSGNGISSVLDFRHYLFINTDLTVHLQRMPEGEWVNLDAVTSIGSHGVGLTETAISDERGRIGRGMQSLLVGTR